MVTIECGGTFEDAADRVALEGLQRFFSSDALFTEEQHDFGLELFRRPMRVELHQAATISCAERSVEGSDITLARDIEHHNFGLVTPDTVTVKR